MSVQFPAKLAPLFDPARYKVLYGGRGGAKSWSVARALLIKGAERPLRVLCAREFQNSIADSVHRVLSDQVDELGLSSLYTIEKASIFNDLGTEFVFAGIRNNVSRIKSYEGVDIVWVEEAQTVSKHSWEVLIPTIRKPGSEIWITFNPEFESDETYQRFVVHPPGDAWVQKINWSDNPWFPEVLRTEKDQLRERDPDAWLCIWEGNCRKTLDGAVYAKELREAEGEGRITTVPRDHSAAVHTFWDLGWHDSTAIWLAQTVGMQTRIIGYIEGSQQPIEYYVQQLQKLPYVWGTDWLPHDARAKQLGTGKSIEEILRSMGRNVRIVPQLSVNDGINAVRTAFPNYWFDQATCADGLQRLRRYRYEVDPHSGSFARQPLHDDASHAADALRYMAIGLTEKSAPALKLNLNPVFTSPRATSWMAS
jgi:phage terminase large subunit